MSEIDKEKLIAFCRRTIEESKVAQAQLDDPKGFIGGMHNGMQEAMDQVLEFIAGERDEAGHFVR